MGPLDHPSAPELDLGCAGETRFMRVESLAKLLADSSIASLRLQFKVNRHRNYMAGVCATSAGPQSSTEMHGTKRCTRIVQWMNQLATFA
jgi:hypothetical protein